MTNMPPLRFRVAACLMMTVRAVASVEGGVIRRQSTDEGCAALDAFQQRVEEYAALHRQLAALMPLIGSRHDRQSATVARASLASAIIAARPTARQGDIFTPEATRFFRIVIHETASAADLGGVAPLMDENGRLLPGIHPAVHTPFPAWETREVATSTLFMLPTLPRELEYRIVGDDLVLWDVSADLIIDVLPYAMPQPASDVIYR